MDLITYLLTYLLTTTTTTNLGQFEDHGMVLEKSIKQLNRVCLGLGLVLGWLVLGLVLGLVPSSDLVL